MLSVQDLKETLKAASREEVEEAAVGIYEGTIECADRAATAVCLFRWFSVAQFALWCVWLA